jgi:hypothetical protein
MSDIGKSHPPGEICGMTAQHAQRQSKQGGEERSRVPRHLEGGGVQAPNGALWMVPALRGRRLLGRPS